MLQNIIKVINQQGGHLSNERLRQAVIDVIKETDAEHKRNINNITCDDSYQSPMKKKDVSTINDSIYYESDEHVDTISDSDILESMLQIIKEFEIIEKLPYEKNRPKYEPTDS